MEYVVLFLVWMIGAGFWRVQKAMGWLMSKAKEQPEIQFSDYWKANRFQIIADACGHILLGLGWASGMMTNALMAASGFQYAPDVTTAQKAFTALIMGALTAPYATQIIESMGKKAASKFMNGMKVIALFTLGYIFGVLV